MLYILLASTLLLRLAGIEHESLWNDELSSIYRSSFDSVQEVIEKGVVPDVHPPGFQVILFLWMRLFGDSAAAVRSLSVLAAVAAVYFVWLIGRKLFDKETGIMAAGFLAVSPVHIWLSQEGRPYSLLIMLSAIAVHLLLKFSERHVPRHVPVLLCTVLVLLEYLHYFGALFAYICIACLLIYRWRMFGQIGTPLIMGLVCIGLYLPWIPYALQQSSGGSYIGAMSLKDPLLLAFEYFSWSKTLLVTFALLFIISVPRLWKEKAAFVPVLWLLLPLTISMIISMTAVPVFTVRNMMVSLPAVAVLAGSVFRHISPRRAIRYSLYSSFLVLSLLSLIFERKHYTEPHRHQFREVAALVAQESDPRTSSVLITSAWNKAYFDYYLERFGSSRRLDLEAVHECDYPDVKDLLVAEDPDEVWFLWGLRAPEQSLIDSISTGFSAVEYHGFYRAGAWRFSDPV